MPYKRLGPLLPHLDPELNPSHPANQPIPPRPLTPDEEVWGRINGSNLLDTRWKKEWLAKAMEEWTPPHVIRSWETDNELADRRQRLLSMILYPKFQHEFEMLASEEIRTARENANNRQFSDPYDFRRYIHLNHHVGYDRLHATQGEPHYPTEETDHLPPEDICWIMEYTVTECNGVRRKIAHHMGLFPAEADPENPLFSEDTAWKWERRLYVRCRRRNQKCVRPSHITVFTSQFEDLP